MPEKTMPEKTMPDKTMPDKTMPEKTMPENMSEGIAIKYGDGYGSHFLIGTYSVYEIV